jgi:hypothetical protein
MQVRGEKDDKWIEEYCKLIHDYTVDFKNKVPHHGVTFSNIKEIAKKLRKADSGKFKKILGKRLFSETNQ